ncbi:flavodoxin [uncultured Methanobrevibacter sp.]|uniref:flavodoxin family protein n=1 Tax=uncultured Methanobrevibacter sp. TaxID=253161 RepID=UPI002612411C|nr:flavodoxin [uncultured Methanobrevibacter sp.]
MKSLVAYYSRTNTTKKLAESIANSVNADIEEVKPKVNYQGKIGFARGGKDALQAKIVDLEDLKYDPADYDVVYLGAPVWAGKAANPLISYIKQNEGKFSNVKFFITAGGEGFDGALKQLEEATTKPQKTLSLTTKEVKKDLFEDKLNSFVE